MKRSMAWLGLVVVLASCASNRIVMNVQANVDPEAVPAKGSTFATFPTGSDLLERELLFMVKQRLLAKGLLFDERRPDLLVSVSGFSGRSDRYVPPSTIYLPVPTTQTTSVAGTAGAVPFYGTATTSGTNYVPIHRNGKTVIAYSRVIDVLIAIPAQPGGQPRPIWQGHVDSVGRTGDLAVVAPSLLDELFNEFPRRSGKGPERTAPAPRK